MIFCGHIPNYNKKPSIEILSSDKILNILFMKSIYSRDKKDRYPTKELVSRIAIFKRA